MSAVPPQRSLTREVRWDRQKSQPEAAGGPEQTQPMGGIRTSPKHIRSLVFTRWTSPSSLLSTLEAELEASLRTLPGGADGGGDLKTSHGAQARSELGVAVSQMRPFYRVTAAPLTRQQ